MSTPGFVHYAGADPAALAEVLASGLSAPAADPFSADLVCAPSRGTQRWLAQELSRRLGRRRGDDGVCAGVLFLTLGQLVDKVSEAVAGPSPWTGDRLVIAVLEAFEDCRGEPWFEVVQRHLQDPAERPLRRAHLARKIARRFEDYQRWDPELARRWSDLPQAKPALETTDSDEGEAPKPQAERKEPALGEDPALWQAGLWKALTAKLGPPPVAAEPAWTAAWAETDPLPEIGRIAVFAPAAWPPLAGDLLRSLSQHHAVTVFSRTLSLDGTPPDGLAGTPPNDPKGSPAAALASGTAGRVAAGMGRAGQSVHEAARRLASETICIPPLARRPTVLGALQAALAGAVCGGPPPRCADGSLAFHASYGPDRQVDVLRDVLLGLLEDDPTLQPRDILVVCPRLEAFQGWLEAAFGPASADRLWSHPAHGIRLRLAGAAVVPANPLLDLVRQVFDLAESRATASELLSLVSNPAVSNRFGLTAADHGRLASLVAASGLRWGISAKRRSAYGLEGFGENTWQAGLSRMALGVALPDDTLTAAGTALPLERVGADQAPLVGVLLEITGRARRLIDSFGPPAPAAEWAARARSAIDLLGAVGPGEDWQRHEAMSLLADLGQAAQTGPALTLADARGLLDGLAGRRRGRDRWLNGDLTVAQTADLHHVPHRVTVWLGLDADSFPRTAAPDGDDLLSGRTDLAFPDVTLSDRQCFLDSLLDSRDRFIVIYKGHDPRTGAAAMAPAPVRDLLSLASQAAGPEAAASLVRHHPVLPFSLVAPRPSLEGPLATTPGLQRPDADNGSRPAAAGPADRSAAAGRPGADSPASESEVWTFDAATVAAAVQLAAAAGGQPAQPDSPGLARLSVAPAPGAGPPRSQAPATGDASWQNLVLTAPSALSAPIGLDDLAAALAHPAAYYLRQRAGLTASVLARGAAETALEPELPLSLDGLARWQMVDRMLRLRRAGKPPEAIRLAEQLRGTLPPRALGLAVLDQCWRSVERILAAAAAYERAPVAWHAIDIALPGRPRLTGQIATFGDVLLSVQAGRPQAKHQLAAWIHSLALQAAEPDRPWRAVVVGPSGPIDLQATDPDAAAALLSDLLGLYAAGAATVLPAPPAVALWAARFRSRGQLPDPTGLQRAWLSEWGRDAAWQTVYADPVALFAASGQSNPVSSRPTSPEPPADRFKPQPLASLPVNNYFDTLVDAFYVPLSRAGATVPFSPGGQP
ncbi:MAG: exodeoxyribonuclease V subunit gamma [Propionibacteriaceae bacterium]|jgi:exodeoxyribonuclease V gamma subunit|nr:exodeoxyribonuclease V subunit gamma [Propionibacteriaceae bacterium]